MFRRGTATTGSVTIPARGTSAEFSIHTVDDGVLNPNGRITGRLRSDNAYRIGSPSAKVVTVRNRDSFAPSVTLSLLSGTVIEEGGTVRYAHSAMRDLLGSPVRVLSDDTLYRCLDKLLAHKRAFFSFLRQRWEVLFQARFDVLLYDLTSTYFESDPPFAGKRQFGYSRDKRSDCVQVVIALVVTPQGFPLAYEVMPGNTSDKTTLKDFLKQIEAQYGRSDRVWIMDRGIPTEETLEQMRTGDSPVHYLVGTPKGRLSKFEKKFLTLPWQAVRPVGRRQALVP